MSVVVVLIMWGLLLSYALSRQSLPVREIPGGTTGAPPKRILIIGATGGTGRRLVEQALERGYEVTAFARTPSKLRVENSRLSVTRGDVLDPAALDEAVRGHDAVLCALGHTRYYTGPRILSDGTRNLIRAMEAHGVQRLVCETSLGVGSSAFLMGVYYTFIVIPFILPLYYWDKTRQERAVAASGLEWTIVRPAALTNGEKRGSYHHGTSGIGSFLWTPKISRADVAHFMLDQLETDAYRRRAAGVSW